MVAAGIFCGGMVCAYNANHDVPKYNPSEPIQRSQSNEWKQKCFSWNQSNSNVDEWWAQHPDWEIASETASNFCFKPIANQEKAVLFKTLHEIGFQHNCSDVFTKSMPSAGWNGNFDKIRDGLMFSLETNRPFQSIPRHGAWHYASRKNISVCPSKDLFCYFLDISQCKPEDDPQHLEHWYMAKNKRFNAEKPGRWLQDYASRPRHWLRKKVFEFSKRFKDNFAKPCMAMHVRRADVILHGEKSRKYHAIQDYLDAVSNANMTIPPNVWLMTDDQNAIDEAITMHKEFQWFFLNRTRHRGAEGGMENQIPRFVFFKKFCEHSTLQLTCFY